MIEPIRTRATEAAWYLRESLDAARDSALVLRASWLAVTNAFDYGLDFPCGAVVAQGDEIVGGGFANYTRSGYTQTHAENMAFRDNAASAPLRRPDTLAVSLEPCDHCQDFIAQQPNIERVVYGIPRSEASDRGLVNPRDETIEERVQRLGLPFVVVHVDDQQLTAIGITILDHTKRDFRNGIVKVDIVGLRAALKARKTT